MRKCLSLFICTLIFVLSGLSYASEFRAELTEKIPQLAHDQPFIVFSLQLTAEEEKLLAQLETNRTDDYNYYGSLPDEKEFSPFIQSLGNNNKLSSDSARIINQKIQDIKEAFHAESVWVAIRSSHNQDEWSTPRWHTDGLMYASNFGFQYKTAFILKGAATLFCHLSDEGRIQFNSIQDELGQILGQYMKEGRSKEEIYAKMAEYQVLLANLIQEYKDKQQASIEQGSVNHGAIFIVGDEYSAAIHSEPHIDSDRLFISVVTGTKEQIQEIKERFENQKHQGAMS